MWTGLMETQIWCCCTVALCGGELKKGKMATVCSSVWEDTVPQFSPWCQILQFFPICHCCPSRCCPIAGAQREWVWVSTCARPFMRKGLRIWQFLLVTQPAQVFAARSYGELSSWRWNPVAHEGVSHGAGIPYSQDILPFYITTWGLGTSPFCFPHLSPSAPPFHLDECGIFNALVVGLPYNSIIWWFLVIFFL